MIIKDNVLLMVDSSDVNKDGILFVPEIVKRIDNDCFSYCKKLKTVIIPKTVTDLGENNFEGCTNLKMIAHGHTIYHVNCEYGVCLLVCSCKTIHNYEVMECQCFPEMKDTFFVAVKEKYIAVGRTKKEAIRFAYFQEYKETVDSYHRIMKRGYIKPIEYLNISESEKEEIEVMDEILKANGLTWGSKLSVKEMEKLTRNHINHDNFTKAYTELLWYA